MQLDELKKIIDSMYNYLTIDAPSTRSYKCSVYNAMQVWIELSHCACMFDCQTYARLSHYLDRKMNDYLTE